MSEQHVNDSSSADQVRRFTRRLLADLRALELMLAEGCIESDRRRIGAEQELFLVGPEWRPASVAPAVLSAIDDPHFVPEIGLFNLEINLDPLLVDAEGRCLSRLETELERRLETVRQAARSCGAEVLLTGILPTLDKSDLTLDNMASKPRYRALDEALRRLRGEDYQFRIKGRDELLIRHSNMMIEACNTSFQVHFQVAPEEFARCYNAAQLVAAPVLAAAANSPLLFGRQLWRETRIALFQQSVDTRVAARSDLREQTPRVSFGQRWVESSVLEIFQEDVSRFPVLLGTDVEEDPFAELRAGRAPQLPALRTHNGSVYRWNRPCYGISEGRPHLRIENRMLPSGPSVVDEVANAALWLGLVQGVVERFGDVSTAIDFDAANESFTAAARLGLGAHLAWPGREPVSARDLLLHDLLPLAHVGLAALGVSAGDAERYLGVIEERVRSGLTGAQWSVDSWAELKGSGPRGARLAALVGSMHRQQQGGAPVHTWAPARLEDAGDLRPFARQVGQIMATDLFTVRADDVVDLLAHVMRWKHIRHVPVEDAEHHLVGLVTYRDLLRFLSQAQSPEATPIPVSQVMRRNVLTVTPETPTLAAFRLMKERGVSGLPVVADDERLVGMLTEHDLMTLAGPLLESYLTAAPRP
jgi:CBS domain-containing protein/gamma-glutamylcysteine synthetase